MKTKPHSAAGFAVKSSFWGISLVGFRGKIKRTTTIFGDSLF